MKKNSGTIIFLVRSRLNSDSRYVLQKILKTDQGDSAA